MFEKKKYERLLKGIMQVILKGITQVVTTFLYFSIKSSDTLFLYVLIRSKWKGRFHVMKSKNNIENDAWASALDLCIKLSICTSWWLMQKKMRKNIYQTM